MKTNKNIKNLTRLQQKWQMELLVWVKTYDVRFNALIRLCKTNASVMDILEEIDLFLDAKIKCEKLEKNVLK